MCFEFSKMENMVAVRWARKNSTYDGVVQYVHFSLIKEIDQHGNVVVLWPRKGKKSEIWKGRLEPADLKSSPEQAPAG